MAAPASITLIPDVISAADGTYTESGVVIPGSPYIYRLGTGLPIPYPTGMQVIPPQGVSNAVTMSGGGYGSWTMVTSAPAAGQFTVDTSVSPTGGQIGFNSADATKTISITYVANTYVNKTWAEAFVTALRDLRDWRGAASGLAGLDASSRLLPTATAAALTVNGQLQATGGGTNTIAATGVGVTSPTINTASVHYGAITFVTGASPSSGTQVRVTMPFAYHAVILTPLAGFSGHGGAYQPEVNQTDSTHWDINFNTTPAASLTYAFYFHAF